MLVVKNSNQLVESLRISQETGTEGELVKWLLYLDTWHGREKTLVELHADLPSSPYSILWYAYHAEKGEKKENHHFYNGGLIFHRDTREWMVHS